MRLIKGQGKGDGIPKAKLVLIKQDSPVRFEVIWNGEHFVVYDQVNSEWCLHFNDNELQEALDICLIWNLNELKEVA